ncbi:MAG TPA: tRNA lysidine(34) synthetase TilS [Burkholderiales bacterium]|nr:tRNA lysidine(34) synthetase TilS [Burkholderiales bacterium]
MAKGSAASTPTGLLERALLDAGLTGGRVVVGLSGGADSAALLHALVQVAGAVSVMPAAVHVHHGLSPHADEWAQFCARLCRDLGVELTEVRVHVDRHSRLGIEGAAREARYAVFRQQRADAVALAHHADDQAETLLMQLLRGAGVRGLSAMPALRTLNLVTGSRLLRPWLALTRDEIRSYAEGAGLTWVEDESNSDEAFDRSFLRSRVLPVLVARYPGLRETLGRTAQNLGDATQLLDDLAGRDAHGALAGDSLAVSALAALSPAGARNLLRWFLETQHLPAPSRDQLDEALRQVLAARADARVRVKIGTAWLRRHRGRLYVEAARREPAEGWRVAWSGQHEVTLPGDLGRLWFESTRGTGLSLARLSSEAVAIAGRKGGERLRPAPNRPSRTLKNLLHEAHVPEWERRRLPLIFVGETLVWVPDVGHDFRFAAAPQESGLLPRWEHQV